VHEAFGVAEDQIEKLVVVPPRDARE